MKCCICNTEASSGSIIMGQGFTCSKDCEQIAISRHKAFIDELKAEPLAKCPDAFETHDFERWALKLAVHVIAGMDDDDRKAISENNPLMMLPENMSLELKDQILRFIPKAYVSETVAKKHDRMFYGGTYCFRQPVPKGVIVRACQKAQILQ